MSNNLSAAQVLPLEILRPVIEYVANRSYFSLGTMACDIYRMRNTLSVCSAWRQAALEYLWRKLDLYIDENNNAIYENRATWIDNYWVPGKTEYLVKELTINVTWRSLFSGEAFEMLTKYMADTPCLPNVLKLRLIIRDKAFSLNRIGDDSVTNGLEFVDLLKLIAPAASWVIFRRDWGEYEGEAPGEDIVYDDENGMRTLIRQLFRNAKYLALDLGRVCITHTSTINNIPQLTALMMQDLTGLDVRTSLLHKTSSTLLDLRVGAIDPRLLICDINGNYIVYPNLKILVIDRFQMSITFEVPIPIVTPESIVPFPRLKSLALHTSYTFADNVLFRGNSSTLQHLIMYIDEDIVTKLNECKALENKHKALHSVVIDETGRDTNLSRVPESQLQEYFGNLLDTAHALKLESRYIVRELIGAMQNGCELNFIQKLHVKDSSLSLYGIMCLVKGLPALGMISCSIYGLDSEFEFIPAKELPNHIATTFENAGKNLHTWKLLNQTRSAFKNIAEYIVLLGLACPNLRRVMSRPCDAARYNAYIAKTIQREPYKKYAAQLTHLHNVAY